MSYEDDFSKPQRYNVPIGEPELADDTAARFMPLPPVLYVTPPSTGDLTPDADLYPVTRHGMRGPRLRRTR